MAWSWQEAMDVACYKPALDWNEILPRKRDGVSCQLTLSQGHFYFSRWQKLADLVMTQKLSNASLH